MITLNDTYQQTMRIIDNVTSTYQTILIIDPLVSLSNIVGTYNCTVENDRGESSETLIVPGETRTVLLIVHITVIYRGTYCTVKKICSAILYQTSAH